MGNIITIRDAALTYQARNGEVEALRGVSFDVAEGEFVSIVGPSGCGKSTLLGVLAGLETLDGGTVELYGQPVTGASGRMGFMPQRDQLFEWRSIRDNVMLGLQIRRDHDPGHHAHVDTLLTRYDVSAFAAKRPDQLSGGMRQRCALIRTLATGPDILLLDEPFSALDYQTRVRIWQISLLVGFFAFWELSCRIGLSDGFLVSSPSRIAATFLSLCRSGDVLVHVGVSCWETAVGFLLGTAAGTMVAVAMWWWPTLSRILDPYLVVLNALPKTALGPIFIVWMGAGTGAIIVMTLAISLIVTILNMYEGFRATDAQKLRLMAAMGASRWQTLRMLVFPANYATLLNTLKVNVGLSWVGVIMGEFLVSRAGLGYLIVYGSQVFNMDLVMTSVLLLLVAAVVMYQLVLRVEKILYRLLGVKA